MASGRGAGSSEQTGTLAQTRAGHRRRYWPTGARALGLVGGGGSRGGGTGVDKTVAAAGAEEGAGREQTLGLEGARLGGVLPSPRLHQRRPSTSTERTRRACPPSLIELRPQHPLRRAVSAARLQRLLSATRNRYVSKAGARSWLSCLCLLHAASPTPASSLGPRLCPSRNRRV